MQSQVNVLEAEKVTLENNIKSLEVRIDELEQPRVLNNAYVNGWGWVTTESGERWQERVQGNVINCGPGAVTDLTLTIRWYLDGEFLYIRELYFSHLGENANTWEFDEIFQFEQQPDFHEIELSYV